MLIALRLTCAVITGLIFILVGVAFLPREFASLLTGAQKFLTREIQRHEGMRP